MKMNIKTYTELITLPTFEERLEYLRTSSTIGVDTFGYNRIFNQQFYKSCDWLRIRNEIIVRDNGCDLGLQGYEIPDGVVITIHHMNPILLEDIQQRTEFVLNPEYLITTTDYTHRRIHYERSGSKPQLSLERTPNDMCPWKKR